MIDKELIKKHIIIEKAVNEKHAEITEKKRILLEQFEAENKEVLDFIASRKEMLSQFHEQLEEQALDEYNQTKNKKLPGGIGIRESLKLAYNENAAMNWCKSNMPVAVKEVLDKKVFETFAKSNEIECVSINKIPKVTFPTSGLKLED